MKINEIKCDSKKLACSLLESVKKYLEGSNNSQISNEYMANVIKSVLLYLDPNYKFND